MFKEVIEQLKQNAPALIAWISASGLLTFFLTRYFDQTNERRKLFAQAYKVALAWQEMLYRVRRRDGTAETNKELIKKFHDLQEEIDYHQGLISVESESLGRSYAKLVKEVKTQTADLIAEAWKTKKSNPTRKLVKESHPNIRNAAESFLRDTRDWLSFWQLPKLWVLWRNRS